MLQDMLHIFNNSLLIFLSFVGIISLFIGSFINVIIARLPNILMRQWRAQCYEFLELNDPQIEKSELYKGKSIFYELSTPRSHCPKCKTPIRIIDNIPILSYIFLRGKCHTCQRSISVQYPIVEALTAILCIIIAYTFGPSIQTVAGCFLTYVLLSQSGIDFIHKLIPDEITLPMIWLGLCLSLTPVFADCSSAIWGAIFGYMSLWTIYWLFFLATKKEGMGYGDFKLLAMLGAWLGWQYLPFIILFSSVLGGVVGLVFLIIAKKDRDTQIPFGPFLAIAGWVALVYGEQINTWYLNYSGV